MSKFKSKYDPTRDNIGKLYRDLQMNSKPEFIEVGDMSNEQMRDLVTDLNDAFMTDKFGGKPFYVMIHQKKDLQMKSSMLRRVIIMPKRPWPEDDTDVFWKDPKTQEIRFCWSLPHWSEMDNIMANHSQFDPLMIKQIIAWKNFNLKPFGFFEHKELGWLPNPKWKDYQLPKPKTLIS